MTNKNPLLIVLDSLEFRNTIADVFKSTLNNSIDKNNNLESNPKELITTDQLANKLQVSNQTIDRWRKKNRIPFVKIGKSYRYDLHIVLQHLAKKKGGSNEQ